LIGHDAQTPPDGSYSFSARLPERREIAENTRIASEDDYIVPLACDYPFYLWLEKQFLPA